MALPEFIAPMLARIGEPFSSDDHLFEIKWDGTRALAFIENGDYRLLNRKQRSRKEGYPELEALAGLPSGAVLDGEIVVMADGKPEFAAMLRREQAVHERRIRALSRDLPAAYVVFDILYRDGRPVMEHPLTERREILAEVLDGQDDPRLIFSQGVVGDGLAFFEEACARELEGVVAKRLGGRYLPGKRTDSWLKIKRRQRLYCAVLGFQETGADLKSLLVAVDDEGTLRYAGKVGSGWTAETRSRVHAALRERVRPTPIIPCPIDGTWVEPGVYCTVDFLEWTDGGELRAPVFVELVRG